MLYIHVECIYIAHGMIDGKRNGLAVEREIERVSETGQVIRKDAGCIVARQAKSVLYFLCGEMCVI